MASLTDFRQYLSQHAIQEKHLDYYIHWVKNYAQFCPDHDYSYWEASSLSQYLQTLSRDCEGWQVDQAEEAIKYYLFWRQKIENPVTLSDVDQAFLLQRAREILRVRHRSISTETSYIQWIKRFLYLYPLSPWTTQNLSQFLTHLAVEKNVAVSTQNQALNALVFLKWTPKTGQ